MDCPHVLLGYKRNSSLEHNPLLGLEANHHTHLQIFINLDPPLDILPPIREEVYQGVQFVVTAFSISDTNSNTIKQQLVEFQTGQQPPIA